jgi:serine/threonine protein kinase
MHLDVKPENILIDAKGDAFLADFDLAVSEPPIYRILVEPFSVLGGYTILIHPRYLQGCCGNSCLSLSRG